MQYPADRDVLKVIWFHKMLIQAPNLNTAQCLQVKVPVSLVQINLPANPISSEFKEQPLKGRSFGKTIAKPLQNTAK
jgi:hypothetical protein